MDSGVGGSGKGQDPYPESDDDNAFFDQETDLNLVYTWDYYGHGVKGPTGYLGYSYLETPGNPTDLIDNDEDGITDEMRDGGPGNLLQTQNEILAYVNTHYNLVKFQEFFGPLEDRFAYQRSYWWTGDEDLDWIAEFNDTGADGVFGTNDTGERDGIPTLGEPNFDKTDIDESDQIGLTGFKSIELMTLLAAVLQITSSSLMTAGICQRDFSKTFLLIRTQHLSRSLQEQISTLDFCLLQVLSNLLKQKQKDLV